MKILETFDFKRVDEGLSPAAVEFGTDEYRSNRQFVHGNAATYTFFVKDGLTYIVYLDYKQSMGFGVNVTDNPLSNDRRDYDDKRIPTSSALRVFNHVIYLLVELANNEKPPFVKIEPKDQKLGRLYKRAFESASIQGLLNNVGYGYDGELRGVFYIRRKV